MRQLQLLFTQEQRFLGLPKSENLFKLVVRTLTSKPKGKEVSM